MGRNFTIKAGEYITPQEKSDTIEYKYYKNNIRKHAPSYTQYYDAPQKNIKRCKIVVDSWYNGKILSMMAYQHKASKEVKTWYYLDIENAKIYKKKEALRYLVNHKLPIKEDRFVECTKSQAIKKLKKILDI